VSPEQLLADLPVVIQIPVAWGEMDALGHVNNAVYFRYIESGRMAYFARLGLMDEMRASGIGPILHSVRCRFRLPLTYPDTVSVGTGIQDTGADRFTMQSRVVSHVHGRIAAEAESVIVMLDYRAGVKFPLTEELRTRIQLVEEETRPRR
jgi:acyl-CoA thioester hydrolase